MELFRRRLHSCGLMGCTCTHGCGFFPGCHRVGTTRIAAQLPSPGGSAGRSLAAGAWLGAGGGAGPWGRGRACGRLGRGGAEAVGNGEAGPAQGGVAVAGWGGAGAVRCAQQFPFPNGAPAVAGAASCLGRRSLPAFRLPPPAARVALVAVGPRRAAMSGPGPRELPPEAGAAGGEAGAEGAGGGDAALGESGLSFTTTDLSLVEMTEVEYTQLQHILYSHMEAAAADGELETRLNSALLAAAGPGAGGFAAGAAPVYPVLCPSALAADAPCLGHTDVQELRMMLLSETGAEEKTPGGGDGARSRADGAAKEGAGAGAAGPEAAPEARAKPAVRVRLEDRFNSIPAEPPPAPRGPEPPEPGVALNKCVPGGRGLAGPGRRPGPGRRRRGPRYARPQPALPAARGADPTGSGAAPKGCVRCAGPGEQMEDGESEIDVRMWGERGGEAVLLPSGASLVTLVRHPSELMHVPLHQQQNKCTTLVRNKTAASATALQFTHPLFTTNACSTSGNSNLSQTQSSSNSCSVLEAAKHQDIELPRAFSFCYQQEIESTKQTLGSRNKAVPKQVWIKVGEEALCKQALNKRNRSRMHQLDTNVERRALGEIQNVGEGAAATQGAWQSSESSQSNLGEQAQSGPQGGRSQRRERHNRMERDRRRRIRICCDELNLLVPFCNAETDKATTLQWTTAFLKYIQERHGDSLKKEFESVFCGKTGRRLKLTRPDSLAACPAQGSLQSSPPMEIK
ncbi:Transcription factor-like 5 protein [Plecturocebus cupreus]